MLRFGRESGILKISKGAWKMGNPSAAQEPSMEEILASIRQIISEDDDGSDAGSTDAGSSDADAGGEDAPSEQASEPEAQVAVEAEDSSASDVVDEPAATGAAEPDLADVATAAGDGDAPAEPARGSGGIFETMEPASPAAAEGVFDHSDIVDTGPYENPFDALAAKKSEMDAADAAAAENSVNAESEPAEPEPEMNVAEPETVAVEAVPEVVAEVVPETAPEVVAEEVVAVEPVAVSAPEPEVSQPVAEEPAPTSNDEPESPVMSAPAPKPVEYENEENLISPEKGASVANAFSSLTHTILSQNARTLDDLVSDMLQPMLKDWLDENLPTLVERLVKQEIDRMARGGRR